MSTIVTDTITGKSTATTITIGSTPVVSASANSMTIRGEGSAQTSIQQGLLKAFATIELDDTIKDSFNATSFTDNGTGDITHTFASAMSSKEHISIGFNIRNGDGGIAHAAGYGSDSEADIPYTTTQCRFRHFNVLNNNEDMRRAILSTHGDLA